MTEFIATHMDKIMAHAVSESPRECCGVIAGGEYIPCHNLSESPHENFIIAPQDWAMAEDIGEITAVVHSHPYTNPQPSQADRVGIESSGLPWLIVNPQTGAHTLTLPTGYRAPLLGREFSYGVLDCLALVSDWYAEHGIALQNFERLQYGWWDRGENLFVENFAKAGFETVSLKDVRSGDALLMQLGSPVPNHCALYLGDNIILHHITGKLSSRDIYGGYWLKHTTHALRHSKSLVAGNPKDMPAC